MMRLSVGSPNSLSSTTIVSVGPVVSLLMKLKGDTDDIYGTTSSHPTARSAIFNTSPVRYIRDAKLHGNLLNPGVTDGTVSSADTGFFVDDVEPLKVFARVRNNKDW